MAANDRPAESIQWLIDNNTDQLTGYMAKGVELPMPGGGGAVSSVAGRTGAVTLTSTDVGLGNVTNTSDANKPVSSATQTALNLKLDASQKAAASGVAPLGSDSVVPDANLRNLSLNGFVPLGVIVTAGVQGTAFVDPAGTSPTVLTGQWVPRKNTFANLLTTTLNPGEIATCTDYDCIFVNASSVNAIGKPAFKNRSIGSILLDAAGDTAIANNAVIQLSSASVVVEGSVLNSLFPDTTVLVNTSSAANNYIDLSAVVAVFGDLTIKITGRVAWAAGTAFDGAFRGVDIQYGVSSSAFSSVDQINTPFTAASNVLVHTPIRSQGENPYIRFRAKHAATTAPNITGGAGATGSRFALDLFL